MIIQNMSNFLQLLRSINLQLDYIDFRVFIKKPPNYFILIMYSENENFVDH